MTDLRCWWCGVEPLGVVEDWQLGKPELAYIPARWPAGDHPHSLTPPTPQQLVADGHATLRRILETP